jgi:hypothetical protein
MTSKSVQGFGRNTCTISEWVKSGGWTRNRCVRYAPMCAHAGFHTYRARRHIGEPRFDLATRPTLPQHDRAGLIKANNVE